MKHGTIKLTFALALSFALNVLAQTPTINLMKPSTTGVPGDEVRVMGFDPAGNLWVGARMINWDEIGLAMLPADQVAPHPLPGGGFDTGAWKVWSSVHGAPIPSLYLTGIAFSSDGTVWIASDGGLTRFRPNDPNPANRWFTFRPGNSPLVLNEVRSIAMDSEDNLWISNASLNYAFSYLFKLNTVTGQWTSINTGQQPMEVAIGNNGHVIISMINVGGVTEFDGTSWVVHPTDPRELTSMVQDAQGNIWAAGSGISGDGLWKWNGSSWQNWPQVGGTITVTGIGKDRDGVVYVSTWYGNIFKMINDTPVFFAAADNIPRSVIGRPNGDIWINNYGGNGTLGTVRHYNAAGDLLSRMNTFNTGLPDYWIDRIRRDSSGNMWFASGQGGLSRMLGSNGAPDASTHWRNWGNHNDLAEPYPWAGNEPMYSVLEDTNGVFWMGGNGVGRWDSVTGTFTHFWNWENSTLDTSGIRTIAKRQGTIWVGTGGSGVSWLNGNDWTRVLLSPTNFDINYVNAMAVDTADNLWVASNYGLRRFAPGDNTTFTTYDTSNSPLPSDYILDVKAHPLGGIWIGTTAGLVRFDGANWTTYHQGNTGMPGTSVYDIARRPSDGLIAIANNQPTVWPYTGGVSTFDGTTWRHYTPNNSALPHWQVVAVEFDGNGNLWASTLSTGVVQIMIGNAPQALEMITAVSRKAHGSAGIFDINLPAAGSPGVECRSSGGNHTFVFTFTNNVVGGNANISSGTGTIVGTPTFSGNTATVNLTGISNAQTVTLHLSNVTDEFSQVLADQWIPVGILVGDTNGNGIVSASDISQAKAAAGQGVSAGNFRSDVNANGTINATDVSIIKAAGGTEIP
jgi:sugar lactone lactonase YvrE